LGIETSSLIALFASAGLAVGMALSGTLQNFAGGVMILLFKPYRVGDFIEAQGNTGTVKEIQIFNTILITPDNKTIVVPNGGLSTGIMTNYSSSGTRRAEWIFSIAYGESYDNAKNIIERLLSEDKRIKTEPAYFIALNELAANSVNIIVRVWVNSGDLWNVYYDINEIVYKTFENKGVSIPYPQMDVHLYNK
jgi:small conductance mechanosensitive channel